MQFQHFDSYDEAMAYLRKQMKAADEAVQPWQTTIKPNDYFKHDSGYGFDIYGQVLPEEEERRSGLEHYCLCRCHSVACPDGEIGDIHVSVIEQLLSKVEFEEARSRGWA